ncbi:putative 2-dehydro-3-deoxyphosphooctonate aldolase [Capsicum annuum]|nr:putative 2-dehydro-3-deoxyphosphooctonate aldolase [Capsicum annuum]
MTRDYSCRVVSNQAFLWSLIRTCGVKLQNFPTLTSLLMLEKSALEEACMTSGFHYYRAFTAPMGPYSRSTLRQDQFSAHCQSSKREFHVPLQSPVDSAVWSEICTQEMANQLYGYNPSSNAGMAGSNLARTTTRSMDDYLSADNKTLLGSSSYFTTSGYSFPSSSPSMLFNQSDSYTPTASRIPGLATQSSYGPPGVDVTQPSAVVAADSYFSSLKRSSSDALYHQTLLGARNTIGQAEAWFSANPLAKRPRFESASNLSIYPQRPGEKDCAHYMQTRTCKFGDSCKFDHPIWVPEGGIPDWKEVIIYCYLFLIE